MQEKQFLQNPQWQKTTLKKNQVGASRFKAISEGSAIPKFNDDKTGEISRKRERKAAIAVEAVGQTETSALKKLRYKN